MGKKSRRPAQQADANKSKPNLFETKLGSKKQEVLGKRSKHGTDKLRSGWSQGVDKVLLRKLLPRHLAPALSPAVSYLLIVPYCSAKELCWWSISSETREIPSWIGGSAVCFSNFKAEWAHDSACNIVLLTYARLSAEHDNTLSEDDKAIARFQKQRFKDMIGTRTLPRYVLSADVYLPASTHLHLNF